MTVVVCTLILGVGSEFVQSFLPNDRDFDLWDIVANIIGSLIGVGLCAWYHQRMLERRRQRKTYNAVPGEDEGDVELGQGHENGVEASLSLGHTLEDEVDNWDEHAADDWDEEDVTAAALGGASKAKKADNGDVADGKKRAD